MFILQAWELHEEGKLLQLVDPDLGEYPEEEVIKYIKVAFFCMQAAASRRPLMSQVVDMLSKNIRLNEQEITAPAFFQDSGGCGGDLSLKKPSSCGGFQCYKHVDFNASFRWLGCH